MTGGMLAALLALAGCDSTYHARVTDGAGMGEGSPVLVSGVQVGEVKSLSIMEGEVDVEFSVASEHELTMRVDSCVLAVRGEQGAGLVLVPGEGAPLSEEQASRPIPECQLPGAELDGVFGQLGNMFGSMLRAFGQGLTGGAGGGGGGQPGAQGGGGGTTAPASPIPQAPLPTAPLPIPSPPPPPTGAGVPPPPGTQETGCAGLSVRVDAIEDARAVPLVLPNGGHRVWLVFQNDRDQTMQTGSVTEATFTDASRRALTVAQVPGGADQWFMPVDVPAHGSARVHVVLDTRERPQLGGIEARGAHPTASPLDRCTVQAAGLTP